MFVLLLSLSLSLFLPLSLPLCPSPPVLLAYVPAPYRESSGLATALVPAIANAGAAEPHSADLTLFANATMSFPVLNKSTPLPIPK